MKEDQKLSSPTIVKAVKKNPANSKFFLKNNAASEQSLEEPLHPPHAQMSATISNIDTNSSKTKKANKKAKFAARDPIAETLFAQLLQVP